MSKQNPTRFTPIPGKPGLFRRDGKVVVRSPYRKGRPSTFRTIKDAEREQAVRVGGAAAVSSEPFDSYARRWVETFQGRNSDGIDEDTRDAYRDALTRLAIPFFKRTPLGKIDKPMVKRYIAHLREGKHKHVKSAKRPSPLATASIQRYMTPLQSMFAEAHEDGLLHGDNAMEVRITGRPSAGRPAKPKALPVAVVGPLMAELEAAKRDLLMALAFTGLRIAEVCGLQWQDFTVDDDGHPVLRVERQFSNGRFKDHPKTSAGNRDVRLAAPLAQRLVKLRTERGNPKDTAPLFAGATGRPFDTHNIRRAMRTASRRIGLPYDATPHMLRHTVASLVYEGGATDVQVRDLLGHKDANFTRQRYLHVVEAADVSGLADVYQLPSA